MIRPGELGRGLGNLPFTPITAILTFNPFPFTQFDPIFTHAFPYMYDYLQTNFDFNILLRRGGCHFEICPSNSTISK